MQDWATTFATAQQASLEGDFGRADSALADFRSRRPESPEAREAAFWRAAINLDPANPHGDRALGVRLLDAYLANGGSWPYGPQARALKAAIAAQDSLQQRLESVRAVTDTVRTAPDDRAAAAKEEETQKELQRLRDELARANAELDLLRRRLTTPRRPPA